MPVLSCPCQQGTVPQVVTIYEVGPRDGLQNEPSHVPTEVKVSFIDKLTAAGFKAIGGRSAVHPTACTSSHVSPCSLPCALWQMAQAHENGTH